MLAWLFGRGKGKSGGGEASRLLSGALELHGAGRLPEAEAEYRRVLAADPRNAEARHNLGRIFLARGDAAQAIACFREAVALAPERAEAWFDLGATLAAQGQAEQAAASYERAVSLAPEFFEAHFNLGIVCRDLGRRDEAAARFRKAVALRPDFAPAQYCLGHLYRDEDRLEEARTCFERALALRADYAEARWALAMSQIPSVFGPGEDPARARAAFGAELEALGGWLGGKSAAEGCAAVGSVQPFALAYQEESNRELLGRYGALCARLMARCEPASPPAPPGDRGTGRALRVGVVSGHFRSHSVWNAIVKGWFQHLDRNRFSIDAFYLGAGEDEETKFAKARAARFEEGVRDWRAWAETIRRRRPDVLIYPEVGMDPMTLRLASLRLAPVQAASWGHPETTGLPTMDHYLSAEDLEPEGAQANYVERLVALPRLGCCFEPRDFEVEDARPEAWGIGDGMPILLCPGLPFKYAPAHDAIFPRLARELGRCRFVFFSHWIPRLSERLMQRLQAAFNSAGMRADDYVSLLPWQRGPAFYGWMKRADVFLDTIGFSGFNTALQALECGLPVVTREGRFLRGRLASGILRRLGMGDTVAETDEAYVALAARLARDAPYRAELRRRIEAGRDGLFRDLAPIRALEAFLDRAGPSCGP